MKIFQGFINFKKSCLGKIQINSKTQQWWDCELDQEISLNWKKQAPFVAKRMLFFEKYFGQSLSLWTFFEVPNLRLCRQLHFWNPSLVLHGFQPDVLFTNGREGIQTRGYWERSVLCAVAPPRALKLMKSWISKITFADCWMLLYLKDGGETILSRAIYIIYKLWKLSDPVKN